MKLQDAAGLFQGLQGMPSAIFNQQEIHMREKYCASELPGSCSLFRAALLTTERALKKTHCPLPWEPTHCQVKIERYAADGLFSRGGQ